ncbi:MAG: HD domain-containing protein [Candidatus Gracilibacteria bacterium]
MTKDKALEILKEFTKTESLLKHSYAVAASMKYYAEKFGEDTEKWESVGLLHDFDYEMFPDNHPQKGEGILKEKGVEEDIIRAIQSHADYTGVTRDSRMEKTLFAVDELSGFVMAAAYVRPEKIKGMEVKSVKKKLKDKGFAAKVSREDIYNGATELGIELDEHIKNVIEALTKVAGDLGIA